MKYLIFLVFYFLIACSDPATTTKIKLCYYQDNDVVLIVNELKKQSITHEFNEAEKCIYGNEIIENRKKQIELNAFGTPPPAGLSTTYRDNNAPFISLLNSNGIKTKVHIYKGHEYFSWSYEDHEKAEELLKLEPWIREMMKKSRASQKN